MRLLYLPSEFSQQRQFSKKVWVYPVLLAAEAEFHRRMGDTVIWGNNYTSRGWIFDKVITKPEGLPFLSLPAPDRVFTKAFDKKYQRYGNYKFHPATHMQVADGCWHGKCTFCVENKKTYQVRDLGSVTDEIVECIRLGFKEIFDDSGTFPTGKWLDDFCKLWKDNKAVTFGCNMRICDVDFKAMKNAGFRMVLFGIESANQRTLDKIQKGIKADDILPTIEKAAKAGLSPHIAGMVGMEDYEDTMRTIELFKFLLMKGYAKTAQMSFYEPPKDQEQGNENYRKYVNKFYEIGFNPRFWWNKIVDIHSIDDFKYLIKGIKTGLGTLCLKHKF